MKKIILKTSSGDYLYSKTLTSLVVDTDENTLDTLLDKKQDTLTFDTAPAEGSTNPVTSGGVYTALADIDTSSVDLSDYVTTSALEAYGYQTEDEVNALITAALEDVENGSY